MESRSVWRDFPTWAWLALLLSAGLVAHIAAVDAPFIFDDVLCIQENPSIISLAQWRDVLWPPVDGSGVSGRPLVNLSLALNYAWGALDPRGYHFFNILAHLLTGCVLSSIVSHCLRRVWAGQTGVESRAVALGFTVGVVWVVHPLQTESVAFTIQRTEILGGLFYLVTLWGFVRSMEAPRPGRWQAVAVVSCLAGMAAKEIVFTAPILVLLIDRAFWAGSFRQAWRSRARMYFGLAATWLMLAWILYQMGGTRGGAAGFGTGAVPWWAYFLRQWEAITLYLQLSFWPSPLVLDYGCGVIRDPGEVAGRGVFLFVLGGVTAWGVVRNRGWGVVAAAFFLILGPSSSVMPLPAQTMAEHRMYLPLAAVWILMLIAIWRLGGRRSIWLVVTAIGAFTLLSVARSRAYHSPLQLWQEAVRKSPDNIRALSNTGDVLFDLSRWDEAVVYYREALRLNPDYTGAWCGLGNVALRKRDFNEAIRCYQRVIAADPNYTEALSNLGMALWAIGKTDEGLAQLQRVIALRPKFPNAHFNLGTAFLMMGDITRARERLEDTIRLRPTHAEAHHNLGVVMLRVGQPRQAERLFLRALAFRPDYPDAVQNLATARKMP